jgi:hypothetical protein
MILSKKLRLNSLPLERLTNPYTNRPSGRFVFKGGKGSFSTKKYIQYVRDKNKAYAVL